MGAWRAGLPRALLQAPDLDTVAPQHLEHGILAREVAGADREHDRSGLREPLLYPFRPIAVALGEQRLPKLRRISKVAVERHSDALHVPARPGGEHAAELLVLAARWLDRAFEQLALRFLRQAVEVRELLHVRFELTYGAMTGEELLAQDFLGAA